MDEGKRLTRAERGSNPVGVENGARQSHVPDSLLQDIGHLPYQEQLRQLTPPLPFPTLAPSPVQQSSDGSRLGVSGDPLATAREGLVGSAGPLPYLQQIQASFGDHDIRSIESHTGENATTAARALGARGYASGNQVAFAGEPDLHTASHEAAHVVQQRSGEVSLSDGLGRPGDRYERHADAVADLVVQGRSAAQLLHRAETAESRSNSPAHPGVQMASGARTAVSTGRRDKGTVQMAAAQTGATQTHTAPARILLDLAGQLLPLVIPEGATPASVSIPISQVSIPGISFETATLRFNPSWNLRSGSITARLALPGLTSERGLRLAITPGENGAAVRTTLENVRVNIPGFVKARFPELTITPQGLSGSLELKQSAQFCMGPVTVTGGSMQLLLQNSVFQATGQVRATLASGLAEGDLTATLQDGTLSQATLIAQLKLPGLQEVPLTLTYRSPEDIEGEVRAGMASDLFTGGVEVGYSTKGKGAGAEGASGRGGGLYASGQFGVDIPHLDTIAVAATLKRNRLGGHVDVQPEAIHLPGISVCDIQGSIEVNGNSVAGRVRGKAEMLGGKVAGRFNLGYDERGGFSGAIGIGTVSFNGLTIESAQIRITEDAVIGSGSGSFCVANRMVSGQLEVSYDSSSAASPVAIRGKNIRISGTRFDEILEVKEFSVDQEGTVSGTLASKQVKPLNLGMLALTAERVEATISSNGLSGTVAGKIELVEGGIFSGNFEVTLAGGEISGSGSINIKPGTIPGVQLEDIGIQLPSKGTPTIERVATNLSLFNGALTGGLEVSMEEGNLRIEGQDIQLNVFGFSAEMNNFKFAKGQFSGSVPVSLDHCPQLPGVVGTPSIEIGITENNELFGATQKPVELANDALGLEGSVSITYRQGLDGGPAVDLSGQGSWTPPFDFLKPVEFQFGYEDEAGLSADITVTSEQVSLPWLQLQGSVTFSYRGGAFSVKQGRVRFDHDGKLFSGTLTFENGDSGPALRGTITVSGIPYIQPFTLAGSYQEGGLKFWLASPVQFGSDEGSATRFYGAITVFSFDSAQGTISATGFVMADIPYLGQGFAVVSIVDNHLQEATLTLSNTFRYPREGDQEIISGNWRGSVSFGEEGLKAASVTGNLKLNIPALGQDKPVNLALAAGIGKEGFFGSIRMTGGSLKVGNYISIDSLSVSIIRGHILGNLLMTVTVGNTKATVGAQVTEEGLLVYAGITFPFSLSGGKIKGTLSASYSTETGFAIAGEAEAEFGGRFKVKGRISYDGVNGFLFDAGAELEPTPLWKDSIDKEWKLFEFSGSIPMGASPISLTFGAKGALKLHFPPLQIEGSAEARGVNLSTGDIEEAIFHLGLGMIDDPASLSGNVTLSVGMSVGLGGILSASGNIEVTLSAGLTLAPYLQADLRLLHGEPQGSVKLGLGAGLDIKAIVGLRIGFEALWGLIEQSWSWKLAEFELAHADLGNLSAQIDFGNDDAKESVGDAFDKSTQGGAEGQGGLDKSMLTEGMKKEEPKTGALMDVFLKFSECDEGLKPTGDIAREALIAWRNGDEETVEAKKREWEANERIRAERWNAYLQSWKEDGTILEVAKISSDAAYYFWRRFRSQDNFKEALQNLYDYRRWCEESEDLARQKAERERREQELKDQARKALEDT